MSNSYEEVKTLRRTIVSMAYKAGEGHIASALSVLDILYVLYSGVVVHDPSNPHWEGRDYVMLSKGHGCLALYAVLANQGYFQYDLSTFCKYNSPFGGHPNRNKVPGVENSSGSLGHGLPIAVGIAKGLKIKRLPNRVFCIVGDGELNEGSNWEAALLASHHSLDNLVVLVDYNKSGDRALSYRPSISDKLQAFGFTTVECDGHCHSTLAKRIELRPVPGTPFGIVLHTTKGKGIQAMENSHAWHHRAPNGGEYAAFVRELA